MNSPARQYFFSDTYGGHQDPDPLALPDADVLISTDFGSLIEHPVRREFDILGREQVTDHLLRLLLKQHDEAVDRTDVPRQHRDDFLRGRTGVFINAAPRLNRANGEPFYVATLRGGAIRIVTTPLSALSAIRDDVETLSFLPNPQSADESNGLYTHREQFRSRLTPVLLRDDSALDLTSVDPAAIPVYDKPWHVAYVDRFGNIITWVDDVEQQWTEILRIADTLGHTRDRVSLMIGEGNPQEAELGTSLGQAGPGALTLYRNGNIDIVRKWALGDTARDKLRQSAYVLLGKPRIGDECAILPPDARH